MLKNNTLDQTRTPIADFVKRYQESNTVRFHMPGHKGKEFLGCERYDITEIKGADSLYEAEGIIAKSERIATELFGSGATFYSTEGSSQCIRAMLYLAIVRYQKKRTGERPVILAARNVHKAFIYAASLLDFDVIWLWPEGGSESLCSCAVSEDTLQAAFETYGSRTAGVYITSPDYLGGIADVSMFAKVCHAHDTLLLVDNAHGAYLHFLDNPLHPMDLGADLCCDSAHKTFPVLTGGAYLHLNTSAAKEMEAQAKHALCLFGSTSPSYLILSSLDLCNAYLYHEYRQRLHACVSTLEHIRTMLRMQGWYVENSDPLRITLRMPDGQNGVDCAEKLRYHGMECEYADADYLVLMITPENEEDSLEKLVEVLGRNVREYGEKEMLPMVKTTQVLSIREAMFSAAETVSVENAKGRICRTPTVSCPPAIPIAVPGERIEENALYLFSFYGIEAIDVVME